MFRCALQMEPQLWLTHPTQTVICHWCNFLKKLLAQTKGIKLDFKSTTVLEPSLKILLNQTMEQEARNPIWLNADILPAHAKTNLSAVLLLTRKFFFLFVPNISHHLLFQSAGKLANIFL
ncbi:hypothetical protein OS493_008530 [Desmophyllum pertusum]|uniref:Menorin-like domain-containing protein n=1 Tax=Desmophyllum pertusum TaxID=174260 RepID=A0A9W9ZRD5_9CNID|nr:hypothetical protein OS493_008530 [Desmophyllum pertusum]